MNIKLEKIELTNFKGVRSFGMPINGHQRINISGGNATGKTTLVDAFHWLLFGKDSTGRADFELKTLGKTGEAVHNASHEVYGEFSIGGHPKTFRKVFAEKWTKKRGRAEREFEGHQVDHFVDGVPSTQREFNLAVSEIANEQTLRILTDPRHFSEKMKWQERRRMLLEVCGDITDADVISSDETLAALPGILGKHGIDDYKKILSASRAETNKQLDQTPARIDEARRSEGETEKPKAETQIDLDCYRAELHRIQGQKAAAANGGVLLGLRQDAAAITAKIDEFKRTLRDDAESGEDEQRKKNNEIIQDRDLLEQNIRKLEDWVRQSGEQRDELQAKLESLRSRWVDEDEREFPVGALACPTCGQGLPAAKAEAQRMEFNEKKAARLESITRDGKTTREKIAVLEKSISVDTDKIGELKRRLEKVGLPVPLAGLRKEAPDPESTIIVKQLRQELADIEAAIADERETNASAISRFDAQIAELVDSVNHAEKQLAIHAGNDRARARIVELEQQERKLGKEYERIEKELGMIEQFTRAKVSLLEEKINSRFSLVRFRLFEQQINGGLAECCEATVNGVPYSDLNNASRINAGLDIINAISDHCGFSAPVWIDNAESINEILPTAGQQIRLYVSRDAALTIKEN